MTHITDRTAAAVWQELVLTPSEQTADYVRRIHWWVRLFGIIWIVMPVVMCIFAVFFLVGVASR